MSNIRDAAISKTGDDERKEIYRLLIADDEYWVRDELSDMLEWERYGISFLAPAEDGEKAWETVEKEKPDILITDVNMPFINGVELVKKVKVRYPDIVVIMLSGYNDFEYVKESLLAGAMDYIMKPISKMQMIQVLTKALDHINEQISIKQNREVERSQFLRASSSLNDREYSALITNEKRHRNDNLFSPSAAIGMKIPDGGFATMLIKIHGLSAFAELFQYDMSLLSYTIKQRIEEVKELNTLIVYNNIYSTSEFVLLVNEKRDVLKEKAYYLLLALKEFTGKVISIGISDVAFSESDLYSSYKEAKNALLMREFSDGSVVNASWDVIPLMEKEEDISAETKSELESIINKKPEELREYLFEKLGLKHIRDQKWTIYRVQEFVRYVALTLMMKRGKSGIDPEPEDIVNALIHAAENMEYDELMSELEVIIENCGGEVLAEPAEGSGKKTVQEIAGYIKEHFFEDLSLSSLSEMYHMESTYLSRLYRRETGMTIMNSIAFHRITRAKELMKEKNASLTDIAFRVGYDDYNYFNRVFRKFEGCSPRDYKDKQIV